MLEEPMCCLRMLPQMFGQYRKLAQPRLRILALLLKGDHVQRRTRSVFGCIDDPFVVLEAGG